MSAQLLNLNPDLRRLRDEGYEIEVRDGYLIIHHVPYVNESKEIKFGKLIAKLELLSDNRARPPQNHQISFMGESPCTAQGTLLPLGSGGRTNQQLFGDVTVNQNFSQKPPSGLYANYYEQVLQYVQILSHPAKAIDATVTATTYKVIPEFEDGSPFNYADTNSSRAEIYPLNKKFQGLKICIIGLGGTGAYILDLIAKTRVSEIHLYDNDEFLQHNAFRSPGAVDTSKLDEQVKKVHFYHSIYSAMHAGIIPHECYVVEENIAELCGYDFVFLSIDNSEARQMIMNYLQRNSVPFIDVGIGVQYVEDALIGTVRVTTVTPSKNDHIMRRVPEDDSVNNEYKSNIQIAELNALNANLAVIKWKKLIGFYHDTVNEYHSTLTLEASLLINDETGA